MFVSIRAYEGAGDLNEVLRRGIAGLKPILQAQTGFERYYFVDCGHGACRAVTCFDTKENSEASFQQSREWVKSNLGDLLPNPPTILKGTVKLREVNPQQVSDGTYVTFQSTRGVGPVEVVAPIAAEKLWPDIVSHPDHLGAYVFREETDPGHLIGIIFHTTQQAAEQARDKVWKMMQERMPEHFPNEPVSTGGTLLLSF